MKPDKELQRMKKQDNQTVNRIVARGLGSLAVALTTMFLLQGCASGGGSNSATTSAWPPATPPPTSQTNTYIGTESPGLYTITIDHTKNSYSYQDLSTNSSPVSGTFTTAANGFLALSMGGYALEMLSRAVVLVPMVPNAPTIQNAIFGITSPACQVVPEKTPFEYLGMASRYYEVGGGTTEQVIGSGLVYGSSDTSGANWNFGGEQQYEIATLGTAYTPTPDPFSATCAANSAGQALVQTAITVPSSIPANFIVGPTGFFIEDRYSTNSQQPDGVSFIGAAAPASPVSLSTLAGLTFTGIQLQVGEGSGGAPGGGQPQLVSFTSAQDSSGKSIALTGGAFPSNDPTQTPGSDVSIDLGAQDSNNNGYFPSASAKLSDGTVFAPAGTYGGYALVTSAGGKYTIFVITQAASGFTNGWILFQQ